MNVWGGKPAVVIAAYAKGNVLENPIIEDVKINGVKNKTFNKAIIEALSLKNRKPYIESIHLNDISDIL